MRRTARLRIGAVLAVAAVVITGTAMSMTMASADPAADPSFSTQALGTNLSLGAGADGTSKASGTSFGNVLDGNASTYWSPGRHRPGASRSSGAPRGRCPDQHPRRPRAPSATSAPGASSTTTTAPCWPPARAPGTITFSATSPRRSTSRSLSASATPRIAEFETYSGTPVRRRHRDADRPDDPRRPRHHPAAQRRRALRRPRRHRQRRGHRSEPHHPHLGDQPDQCRRHDLPARRHLQLLADGRHRRRARTAPRATAPSCSPTPVRRRS